MKYNKLVRDKIPEIIKQNNCTPITHIADDEEYGGKLKEKLKEEIDEFFKNSTEEELADILEVVYAIRNYMKIDKDKLEEIREKKTQERGAFEKKIILDETR